MCSFTFLSHTQKKCYAGISVCTASSATWGEDVQKGRAAGNVGDRGCGIRRQFDALRPLFRFSEECSLLTSSNRI